MRITYKNYLIEEYDTGEVNYFIYDNIPLYIDSVESEDGYDADYTAKSLADAKAYIDIKTHKYN